MIKDDKKNIEDILSLTPMQEGMLFHYLKEPRSDHYFEQLSLEIAGKIEPPYFEQAWAFVIETNEMLRTIFRWEGLENPIQIILKKHRLQWTYYDFSGKSTNQKKKERQRIKLQDRKEKFDLQQVPFRVTLCKLEHDRCEMIISNHHILYDGWSTGIILKEFFNAYDDLSRGNGPVKPVKTGFKEFIHRVRNQDIKKQEKYWRHYLEGVETGAQLPLKRKKAVPVTHNKTYPWKWTREKTDKITDSLKKHQLTLASLLYSAWGILLQKYHNRDDVIFGTTVSGRSAKLEGVEEMVGLFINTLPLRVRAFPHENLVNLLTRTNHCLQTREEYEHTPLMKIKDYSRIGHEEELFDTIVVIENYPLENLLLLENSGLSVDSYSMFEMTHYDLTVAVKIFDDIEINFSYNNHLFEKDMIAKLSTHFTSIVQDVIENPGKKIYEIDILSEGEKRQLLYDFNNKNNQAEYPKNKTIHRLFEEQVERTPARIALVGKKEGRTGRKVEGKKEEASCGQMLNAFGGMQLSYRELNERASQLTGILRKKGVKTETIAAIMMERSIEMIIEIMGILKAGAAYLPIDPDYPGERIKYMLADSGAKVLVTTTGLSGKLEKRLTTPPRKTNNNLQLESTSLAYIIYTSGTTGKPKGIMIEHENVAARIISANFIDVQVDDRLLLTGSIAFDITTFEIWWPLLKGVSLYLVDQEAILDAQRLRKVVEGNHITIMHLIPQLFDRLAQQEPGIFAGLRCFLVGGDLVKPLHVNFIRNKYPRLKILHMYGPTENTTFSTFLSVDRDYTTGIPIGRPVSNCFVYILDKYLQLLPMGVAGELCASGAGIARGYLNKPVLTSEKFIEIELKVESEDIEKKGRDKNHPSLIYRTGDFARWLPDGNIEFLSRIDRQVKIRGFRIELGEIEKVLLTHPQVVDCAVAANDIKEDKQLVAYYVTKDKIRLGPLKAAGKVASNDLREFLNSKLPGYMVPTYLVEIEKMPLTHNGKVNRKELPEPEIGTSRDYAPPTNEIEERLVQMWSEILGIEKEIIGINSNFFYLGGHSLRATTLTSKIHKELKVKVPLAEVFKRRTIRELSRYIKEAGKDKYTGIEAVEKREYYSMSSAQKRLFFLDRLEHIGTSYNMSAFFTIRGKPGRKRIERAFKELIARHESLRTSVHLIDSQPVQRIHDIDEVEFEIENKQVRVKVKVKVEEEAEPFGQVLNAGGEDLATENTEKIKGTGKDYVELRAKSFIKNFIRPFDLSRAPLLRVGLVQLAAQKFLFLIDMHHIISDGTSIGIMIGDFVRLFNGEKPMPLRTQYKDFSRWQNHLFETGKIKKQEDYWLDIYKDTDKIPKLKMPTDYPRPGKIHFQGNIYYFKLGSEDASRLKKLAIENGHTLYMHLSAVFYVLLHKYTGQEDIIVGTGIVGRPHPDLENIVGMFVNSLAIRNYPQPGKTYWEFLNEVKINSIHAFENQDVQFEFLVDKLNLERDASRNPLFDVLFVVHNFEMNEFKLKDMNITPCRKEHKTSKFDLALFALESDDEIVLELEYSTKMFKPQTIEQIAGHYIEIFKQAIENTQLKLENFQISDDLTPVKLIESQGYEENFNF